ncbi:dihydroneopterin aldolase [Candidatus Bipolaricaulota bacterium]|nr:dihydroneopterin aldolase [Candidatus Bipolaricaulota bacterium]
MSSRIKDAWLIVSGIELLGFHGCYEVERVKGNRFCIDLRIEGEFHKAFTTDSLTDSIDYGRLVSAVREINRAQQYTLIESLAQAIANGLLERFPRIKMVSIRVEKLNPPGLGKVKCTAIELEMERT